MNLENHYYDEIDGNSDERDITIIKGRSIGTEKGRARKQYWR